MLRWLWIALLVIALDQWSKYAATIYLDYADPVHVIPFFNLTLLHNTGAAFSFLSEAGGWQRWFFATIAVVVSLVIVVWIARLEKEQRWLAVALALVLGGAIGNLWDRLYLGYVIDFIDVYYKSYHWPAFNIADSAIFAGGAMLLIDGFFFSKDEDSTKD
jgi:signal peptidase II